MTKEERLTELARLINKLRNECLMGDRYLPIGDVRRYNELVHALYGDELGEDPEIMEAKGTGVLQVKVIYRDQEDMKDPLDQGSDMELPYTETVGVKAQTIDGEWHGIWVANVAPEPLTSRQLVDAINIQLESLLRKDGQ